MVTRSSLVALGVVWSAVASLPAQGGYLVVAVDLPTTVADAAGFRTAAESARTFHRAELVEWDGKDFDRLAALCRDQQPANVLFVLRPGTLDLVLHRRILLQAAKVDADPCVDFAFGYLTAESGDECAALWRRIEALHRREPRSGMWWQASVCSADTSFRYPDSAQSIQAAAGFHSPHHYFANRDPARLQAVDKALAELVGAEVAEFTGCGDPQGIWLFADERNRQRDKHWDYAKDKVGQDPDGEMPRLLASRFRSLNLASPIVWSGTCHSGATERVFVEGDIVSTFGRTEVATVHRLAVDESLALAWLHAGAAALLVPLGANHGLAVSNETDFALEHGASLGAAVKSTWDDVFLAAGGELKLDLPVEGEPHRHGEKVMQGGGANRILIGDPSLRPFRSVAHPRETTSCERRDSGLCVTVARQDGFVARGWDMYGASPPNDWRVVVRVDLTALGVDGDTFTAEVEAKGGDGKPLPYSVTRCVVEHFHGKRFLHLQANGRRTVVENKAVTAVFTARRG
jgi:hypothetical protein